MMENLEAAKRLYIYYAAKVSGKVGGKEYEIGKMLHQHLQDNYESHSNHSGDLYDFGDYLDETIPTMIRKNANKEECYKVITDYLSEYRITLTNDIIINSALMAAGNLAIYQKLFRTTDNTVPSYLTIEQPFINYTHNNISIDFNFSSKEINVAHIKGKPLARNMHKHYPNFVKEEHMDSDSDFRIPFTDTNALKLLRIFTQAKIIPQEHTRKLNKGLANGLKNGLDPDGPSNRR
jgi:hypothetical protein